MVLYNYQDREITGKIVYYGPSAVGKSTSLRHIYDRVDEDARGKLMQAGADEGRMLSFDFLPVNVGEITGMKIRFQLVTAPGASMDGESWGRVLQGADAIVFVADSDPKRLQSNRESYEFLMDQLDGWGVDSERIPLVFQLNKRDLSAAVSVEQINQELNLRRVPWFASSANTGEGVLETFQTIGRMLLVDIGRRYKEELLRKKREQAQRAPVPDAVPAEAAEPEEETRAIRVGESRAAQGAVEVDEAPTKIVEPDLMEEAPAEAAAETGVEPAEAESVSDKAVRAREPVEESMAHPSRESAGNGRGHAPSEEPERDEDDEPTAADLRVAALQSAGGSDAAGPAPTEVQALRAEIAQVAEQSLRLLEGQSRLLRRVEEIRQRVEKLANR